ncbi:MAG: hypothetical protein INQ03_02505 [Candidatus Heimdallarchaeota archaeon]|nr:hypothetical protein [Candidatus Heimdallarchaeota archaeon]
MVDSNSLTRKGPERVWKGYRNLRVPEEIFEDVKTFMVKRKIEYRASIEGIEVDALSQTTLSKELESKAREMLEQMLKERGIGGSGQTVQPVGSKVKNTRERVADFLEEHAGEMYTTTQIANILDIPGSSLREAARTLAKEEPEHYILIAGRPNKISYKA